MQKKNIRLLIISLSITFWASSQIITDDSPRTSSVIDKIVAQVGNNPILFSDIESQKLDFQEEVGISNCQILEELLYQNLLLNQAKIDSIEISDAQVNAEMENRLRTIEQQIGGREKLEKFYGKTYTQIKEEFRDIIRDRMLSQEQERKLTANIEVSPDEVKRFFNSIPKDSIPDINEKIALQQIVVYPKITQESRNKVIEKLQNWRKQVVNGESTFATLATLYSEDIASAKSGGKIEATRGMMVKPFEAAAFSLQPGEISDVVETQYGYHLIELVSRKGDDYTIRHILLSPEVGRKELSDVATLIDECHERLKKHEITWKQAVEEYSEDDETRRNEGNLSNPYTGEQYWDIANINEIDPQIFSVIYGMEVGEISEPALYSDYFSRKEAVRIIRVKDRTEPHVANLKDDYNFIKMAAENEKKQKIIANWINKNSKKTYIRIDNEYKDCSFQYKWN